MRFPNRFSRLDSRNSTSWGTQSLSCSKGFFWFCSSSSPCMAWYHDFRVSRLGRPRTYSYVFGFPVRERWPFSRKIDFNNFPLFPRSLTRATEKTNSDKVWNAKEKWFRENGSKNPASLGEEKSVSTEFKMRLNRRPPDFTPWKMFELIWCSMMIQFQ